MSDNPEGKPPTTDEQFKSWLELMEPFLKNSNSLYYSMKRASIESHKKAIYGKYAKKDWFGEKIDELRREPGELVNDAIVTQVRQIQEKIKRGEHVSNEENKLMMFYAEKSRSAQPFFVNRQETATAKPIEEVLGELEREDTINDVAEEAAKQVVETNPPLQDQG